MAVVLGYNGFLQRYPARFGAGHDSAAAIVVDGELVAAVEEERLNREKHSGKFPRQAIEYCLREAGLSSLEQVDLITYYWDMEEMFRQDIYNQTQAGLNAVEKTGLWTLLHAARTYNKITGFNDGVHRRAFERGMDCTLKPNQWKTVKHHLCHVASTFYDSPFEESLVMTLDASGECVSSMVGVAKGTQFDLKHEMFAPNSLGYLYLFITDFLGFQINNDEYKVMGLAPYGKRDVYRQFFRSLINHREDGTFQVDPSLMLQLQTTVTPNGVMLYPPRLAEALGPPRKEHEPITQRHMDIAAALQETLEHTVLTSLTAWQKRTGQKNLCLAGGVALNSTMNGVIAHSGLFEQVWVHTAAHDAGTSVGAALYGYHNILNKPRHFQKKPHRYLGPAWGPAELDGALKEFSTKVTASSVPDVAQHVAQALSEGKVVGLYQGRMEWGPRALGNRTIMADPRRDDMKDIVNHAVKLREGFRPFAPATLAEKASEWFDLTGLPDSPYMLFVVPVHQDKRSRIPAVTHVDGSARVQTVTAQQNPRFHAIISAFDKLTGVPVVMNTSFNVKGEAIVNTPADAIRCFLGTQIDLLVIEDTVIEKRPEVAQALLRERGERNKDSGRVVDGRINAV